MAFIDRYASAFGPANALLLRVSGLTGGEVRAEGPWIDDDAGRRWLDFGSFGVHLLGHRHPAIVAAARDQLSRMGLSGKILGSVAATACAEALLQIAPDNHDRLIFANSGAEAVEAAIKIAALATGRSQLAALENSYHGKTTGAASLSQTLSPCTSPRLKMPVHFVRPDDTDGLATLLSRNQVAALFAEPVQGEGGVRPIPREALDAMARLCRATGTLFVLDEIQTGLGRCGTVWRSALDVSPDMLLVGKTLGGGLMPVSATLFSSESIPVAGTDPVLHASSFAAGALAGAVGRAVVEIVRQPPFLDSVRADGEFMRERLSRELHAHAGVRQIRGEGLMIGIEFEDAAFSGRTIIGAARLGLLVSFCIHEPRVLRVYPPAGCAPEVLERAAEILGQAVASAAEVA